MQKARRKTALAVLSAAAAALTTLGGVAWAQEDPGSPTTSELGGTFASVEELAVPSTKAAGPSMKVVARGLDNPRGMALSPGGALFVAEAGAGGDECFGEGPEGRACYGETGAVTRIKDGGQARVARGLPSFAGEGGFAAAGPHDVSLTGGGEKRKLFVTVGEGPREDTGDGRFSRLLRLKDSGTAAGVADLLAHEVANNPDGGVDPFTGEPEVNSNPYSAVSLGGGGHAVADAAGNSLIRVDPDGGVRTRAVFPTRPVENPEQYGLPPGFRYQSVPDAVAKGPDGSFYVGELTGFPFPVGEARVYRVKPGSDKPKVHAEGFSSIIDLAAGPDGSLYVLELAKKGLLQAEGPEGDLTGRLVRVYPDGRQRTVASEGLVAPSGVAVGPKGAVYVSNFGIFPDQGQVVRIGR